ncbi:MAG: FecR domain-containing protein [Polyangiaceae bacterium]|nr:FecR domain-containing protein [Polyangiaceae bacterium]
MTQPHLQRAGRLVREHLVVPERPAAAVAARVALVDLVRSRGRLHALRLASVLAAALAMAMPLGWLLYPSSQGNISFRVGPEGRTGQLGAYVSPPAGAHWDIDFSDGSRVALQPLSHARVTRTMPNGAEVLLENGRARVDVVHRPRTNWSVIAGPYTVHVTGTSFDLSFDARTQTLEVDMRAGAVRVEGPGIDSPVEIRGAQQFVHRAGATETSSGAAARHDFGTPMDPGEPDGQPTSTEPADVTETITVDVPAERPLSAGPHTLRPRAAREPWAQLCRQGSYKTVVAQAEEQGLSQALRSASSGELMALGHAARFVGRKDIASSAYLAVRSRFGTRADAAAAAFFLGRMVESRPTEAVIWYERYAAEAPSGAWIPEALGRRMVLLKKSGDGKAALEAARAYLLRFPHGPYAGVAREMTAGF